MRQPIANKTHYANGITLLDKQIEEICIHEKGPGDLPLKKQKEGVSPVKAAIVPHGPYPLAGPCMAWAYHALAQSCVSDKLFILIAQAQFSTGSGTTTETFITPYGEVRVDQHFVRELIAKGNIALNTDLHAKENSIEVQLPFLQFIFKRHQEQIKIVPLIINTETDVAALKVDIKETLLEQNKQATLLFLTNFTSYGRDFQYVPFTEDVAQNIALNDKLLLDALQELDKGAFEDALTQTLTPLSGRAPLELFFSYFSKEQVSLEQYYLSGDINNNYKATVSYATLLVK